MQNNMQEQPLEQLNREKKLRRLPLAVQFIIALFLLAVGALCLMYIMKENNYYASGNDAWGHLFKSNLMYQGIKEGNYYPLLTNLWYNGIQAYRYWAPLPYYILAMLQWLGGGDVETSYYLFAGVAFFIGGIGWLLWGISTKRMVLCSFISLIWFFLPENIRVFFCEGNIPRMVTAILIPYLVYFIWIFVKKEKRWASVIISTITALLALSHLMISAMVGITAFIFLLFHCIATKKFLRSLEVIISMLIGYVLTGIWLVPALVGGLVGMNSEASASVMESLTYSLQSTLNPFNRVNGITDTFYYGISIVLISVVGIMLSGKKDRAGYFTNIVILICTTPAMIPLLSKLPLSQLFWMMRFATIAYAFFFWSLIEWKNARRYFVVILCTILLIDCFPSLSLNRYYTQTKGSIMDELETAKEITKQRVAILDLSYLGSYPSWELCEGDDGVQYTYGWAWQGASTSTNIVMLNTSLEKGNYEYMFDRCIELGNDTVVVYKELVEKINETEKHLINSAEQSKYYLYQETNEAYIFHMDTPDTFGVQTQYRGFGIGEYVSQIVFPYPTFIGESVNIQDYTVEKLSQYETLYLSGFEYYDRLVAEAMVTELANMGVRVVIDMTHIPVVQETKRLYFLGVVAQDIEFETMFPTLTFQGNEMYMSKFPEEYPAWNTKYIEGVDHVWGSADYYGQKLVFAGTKDNDNIVFMGFNLLFYCTQTQDENAYKILNKCFNKELYELPVRKIVPITVKYEKNKIVIDTTVENINTTIAYQDIFVSDDNIINQNNLLFITQKHTEITLVYPYLKQGALVSLAGFVGILLWMGIILLIDLLRKRHKIRGE